MLNIDGQTVPSGLRHHLSNEWRGQREPTVNACLARAQTLLQWICAHGTTPCIQSSEIRSYRIHHRVVGIDQVHYAPLVEGQAGMGNAEAHQISAPRGGLPR